MPLRAVQPVPVALLPMSGAGLPSTRPDLLLSIIVRSKRSRASDVAPSKSSVKDALPSSAPRQSSSSYKPTLPSALLPPKSQSKSGPNLSSLPMIPGLGLPLSTADDDDTPYSPGSSPEPPVTTLTPPDTGLSEKLARLQAEVSDTWHSCIIMFQCYICRLLPREKSWLRESSSGMVMINHSPAT